IGAVRWIRWGPGARVMQLPDESIEYGFPRLLAPPPDPWTPLAELQIQHFLPPERLEPARQALEKVRSQVAAERSLANPPARLQPFQPGFIDLSQQMLDQFRRKGEASELGKVNRLAVRLRENCDRVVLLGIGGSYIGAKALFDALCHSSHNELPP